MENEIVQETPTHPWVEGFEPLIRWANKTGQLVRFLSITIFLYNLYNFIYYKHQTANYGPSLISALIFCSLFWFCYYKLSSATQHLKAFIDNPEDIEIEKFATHLYHHFIVYLVINALNLVGIVFLILFSYNR